MSKSPLTQSLSWTLLVVGITSCSQPNSSSIERVATSTGPNQVQSNAPSTIDVEGKVKRIISEQLGLSIDEFSLNDSLTKKLGADELDIVELVMSVEEEFGLTIPDEKIVADNSDSMSVREAFCGMDFVKIVQSQMQNESP